MQANLQPASGQPNIIASVRARIRALVTEGAASSGWGPSYSRLIGTKADEAAASLLAAGKPLDEALASAVATAELIASLDVFCNAWQEHGDAWRAFEVIERMRLPPGPVNPATQSIHAATREEFGRALAIGLAPPAALACAYASAAAAQRLLRITSR